MLKPRSILGAGMAMFFFVMACTQGVSFAGDAYDKSRAKALSNVSERYNYYKVDDPTDLVVTKDILKLQKQPHIGLDARKFRGYAPTLNYGEVSNMHLPDRVSIATPFRSKGLVGKPQGYGENLGTLTNCRNRGTVRNHVKVKNTGVGSSLFGDKANLGIVASNCEQGGTMNLDNSVSVKSSRVGGVKGLVVGR